MTRWLRTAEVVVPRVLHGDHRGGHLQSVAREVVDLVEVIVPAQPVIALDQQQWSHHIVLVFEHDPHPRITAAATRQRHGQVAQIAARQTLKVRAREEGSCTTCDTCQKCQTEVRRTYRASDRAVQHRA